MSKLASVTIYPIRRFYLEAVGPQTNGSFYTETIKMCHKDQNNKKIRDILLQESQTSITENSWENGIYCYCRSQWSFIDINQIADSWSPTSELQTV